MDMRFGTWNVRRVYTSGSLKTVARQLGKYKLDLVCVQEVRWDKGGTERAEDYTLFYGAGNGRGLCDGLITRSEKSYHVSNCVFKEPQYGVEPGSDMGCSATGKISESCVLRTQKQRGPVAVQTPSRVDVNSTH
jgi:exonuclease III